MNKKGFTALEAVISLGIFLIIIVSLYQLFMAGFKIWETGNFELFNFKRINKTIPILEEKIKSAKQIIKVSLVSNKNGYIQYLNSDNYIITIFINTNENKQLFKTNNFPTANIVMCYFDQHTTSDAQILMRNTTSFAIETFGEDSGFFRIATLNNSVEPIPYSEIKSIRIRVQSIENNKTVDRAQYIHLFKYPIESAGNINYPLSSETGFTLNNISLLSDDVKNTQGFIITPPSYTVKIANTGLYFSSIQAAIDQAVSGNEIWVAQGTYDECITLKTGVKVLGGFESYYWHRNVGLYTTTIRTKIGFSDKTVTLANNSTIDGFTIDGRNLIYAIYGNSVNNITISNCQIINADNTLYLNSVAGKIFNNNVTSNSVCLTWSNSSNGEVYRNRFFTNNYYNQQNIYYLSSSSMEFRNNVINGGNKCIEIYKSSINIINNLIMKAKNIALYSTDVGSSIVCANNMFVNNNFGIFSPNINITAVFNYFNGNRFGNAAKDYPTLAVSNLIDSNLYDWNSSNPIINLTTYELLDGSACIDTGHDNSIYYDVYTADNINYAAVPAAGTRTNDIGPCGGPKAGRIGPGNRIAINSGDSIQSSINSAYPYDFINFTDGDFSVGTALNIRNGQIIMGNNPETTRLNCTASSGLILDNDNKIENIALLGNNSNNGINIIAKQNINLKNLLLLNFDNAIYVNGATSVTLNNLTCSGNNIALNANGSSVINFYNSIITTSAYYGISSLGSSEVNAFSILFYYSPLNGSVQQTQSIIGSNPSFWDPADFNYSLQPTSAAINAGTPSSIALGCFEFYSNIGRLDFPIITSRISRSYKTITAIISDDSNCLPAVSARTSQVEMAYILGSTSIPVTLSAVVTVTSNNKITYQWNIAPNIIGKKFQLRAALKSYKYLRTPYLNDVTIAW